MSVWKNAAAVPFLHNVLVVFLWFVAEEGEAEAVLSVAGLCMTGARIATGFGEDGCDIVDKGKGTRGICRNWGGDEQNEAQCGEQTHGNLSIPHARALLREFLTS